MIVRQLLWRHPEWWTLALASGAWLVLLVRSASGGHAHHDGSQVAMFAVMIAAMMLPTLIDPIREVAGRSFWYRRHRAIAAMLSGYLSIWILCGSAITAAFAAWLPYERGPFVPIALVIAAAWQLSPLKWRAVMACHRRVALAPRGWRATRDCVRQGWTIGLSCVVACAPMMAACALTHDIGLMTVIAGLTWMERFSFRPRPFPALAALPAMAVIVALTSS